MLPKYFTFQETFTPTVLKFQLQDLAGKAGKFDFLSIITEGNSRLDFLS